MGRAGQRQRVHQRIRLWKRDRLPDGSRICYICGCKLSKRTFTLDHIDPFCFTQNNKLDNMAICCFDCNQAKDDMSLEDYLKTIPSLLLRVARLKYKPASYAVLMNQRGIRIAIYRFFSP